jgi:hypothetical protein
MKKLLFILCISTGLILGCNSNKKSSAFSKRKGNSPSVGAPGTVRKSGSASATSDSSSNQTSKKGIDSMLFAAPQSRAFTNFQGSSGTGTGGSYASHAYRHDKMSSKNAQLTERRRAYFKKRQFDEYYPEDMKSRTAIPDSSLVEYTPESIPNDSTGIVNDSTSTTIKEW